MASKAMQQFMMQQMQASIQARQERERADKIAKMAPGLVGQQAQAQETDPYEQGQSELFPGEQQLPGLMNITQEETPATGLFDMTTSMPERNLAFNQRLLGSGMPGLQKQAITNLSRTALGSTSEAPSSVREWSYYDSLNKDDQARFLEMKRNSNQIIEIGGVPSQVSTISGQSPVSVSSLEAEKYGQSAIAAAKETATGKAKGEQQRFNALRTSAAGRQSSIRKAQKFLNEFESRNASSGAGRKALSYLPGVYTDQGRLDEEFNSFAEIAARQALKASGEVRPTDADVVGMKRAMFGIGRDESVNMSLLKDYIEQQQMDEDSYTTLKGSSSKKKTKDLTDADLDNMTLEELEALK